MEIEAFLAHNVENYLFGDLAKLEPSGVGYPWLMTSFAGIELFGALLSSLPFPQGRGKRYFVEYWANHLYDKRASTAGEGLAVYKLVRNGIAHQFIPKGPIHVAGDQRWRHLTLDDAGNLFVDPKCLGDDLVESYRCVVLKALAVPASRNAMNRQLRLILGAADTEATALSLVTRFPARPAQPAAAPVGTPVSATNVSMMTDRP